MKVFISIDLEGATGVCHLAETDHGSADWQAARGFMRGDLDAVLPVTNAFIGYPYPFCVPLG